MKMRKILVRIIKNNISLIMATAFSFGILIFINIQFSLEKDFFRFFNNNSIFLWPCDFQIVEIKSVNENIQKAYFYRSESTEPMPLLVSLHTWSGDYKQYDPLAELSKRENINYIHPDFRGSFVNLYGCCSEIALKEIDESISYAIKNANVDKEKIYLVGVSGGGYAVISAYMKSKHKIRKFSAWASISDLSQWRIEKQQKNIKLNRNQSEIYTIEKSPLYWNTPIEERSCSQMLIYAGINDGISGSVPITHSINMYNKILKDLKVKDSIYYVTKNEEIDLLKTRMPIGEFGRISSRKICLKKRYENIQIIIFEGGHEMLVEHAFRKLLE